jgi:hypothetical protein
MEPAQLFAFAVADHRCWVLIWGRSHDGTSFLVDRVLLFENRLDLLSLL